jgi:hypothetical protein
MPPAYHKAPLENVPLAEAHGWTLAEAQRRNEIAIAIVRSCELDLGVKSGLYVLRSEALSVITSEYAIVRELLLSLPGKCALKCVGRGRYEIEELLLRDEIYEALTNLSDPSTYERTPPD